MSDRTLDYYGENAEVYAERTRGVSQDGPMDTFVGLLGTADPFVLDTGCGSGRDTAALMARGCRVLAADGSPEMARLAGEATGAAVIVLRHQEMALKEAFDGVWASATLLHVPREEMVDVFGRYRDALRPGGILYASFKMGEPAEDGPDELGRDFTYMSPRALRRVVAGVPGLQIVEMAWDRDDLGRSDVWWLAVWLRRTEGES